MLDVRLTGTGADDTGADETGDTLDVLASVDFGVAGVAWDGKPDVLRLRVNIDSFLTGGMGGAIWISFMTALTVKGTSPVLEKGFMFPFLIHDSMALSSAQHWVNSEGETQHAKLRALRRYNSMWDN